MVTCSQARLREKLEYEDLGGTPGNSGAGSKGHVTDGVSPGPALRLHKTSRCVISAWYAGLL